MIIIITTNATTSKQATIRKYPLFCSVLIKLFTGSLPFDEAVAFSVAVGAACVAGSVGFTVPANNKPSLFLNTKLDSYIEPSESTAGISTGNVPYGFL